MALFDVMYHAISAGLAALLAGVTIGADRVRRRIGDARGSVFAMALALAAAGAELALIGGVSLNAVRPLTGDLLYQRTHFAIFYVGFAAMLFGAGRLTRSTGAANFPQPYGRLQGVLDSAVWLTFVASAVISSLALAIAGSPASQADGASRHVPQQTVFFLPVFLALAYSALIPTGLVITSARGWQRRVLAWFAIFVGLSLLGFLREANVIPSSGEPMLDLLVAFGPFALAGACLVLSLRSLATSDEKVEVAAQAS